MENNFIIRHAGIGDLAEIQRLNLVLFKKEQQDYDPGLNINWTYGRGEEYFRSCIENSDKFAVVADNGGKIIGYLCGGLHPVSFKKGLGAELDNMFVEADFRNNGVGGELVAAFISWCRKEKVDYVKVAAFYGNRQGIDFYRRNGFQYREVVLENKLSNNATFMATKKSDKSSKREEFKVSGQMLLEKVKELIKEGNVRRIIIISEKGETMMEIPLTFAVVGTAFAPVLAAVGALAALIANCTIVVERK